MIAPPDQVIELAVEAAKRSPCAKSKRGAVIFEPRLADRHQRGTSSPLHFPMGVVASGRNHPPFGFQCDGSDACRASCGEICLHAESEAIRAAVSKWGTGDMSVLDLVHVKVVAGELVAGGPPSCWQCSREVADHGISVWLYENSPHDFSESRHCPTTRLPFKDCGYCQGEFCATHDYDACDCAMDERHEGAPNAPTAVWRRYTAAEFHIATAKNKRLHVVRV